MQDTIYLQSFSRTEKWYRLSLARRTCDCAAFRTTPGAACKHLKSVGIYGQKRSFLPTTHPTFSQALSALVKSLRIRRADEAIYWLVYLGSFAESNARYRTARRLLVGSAEDGHSIAVMEATVKNFPLIARADTDLLYLAAEALRICSMPNWWEPRSGGKDYIYSGLLAERALLYYPGVHSAENMSQLLQNGIARKDKVSAIAGVIGLSHARLSASRQAQLLERLAIRHENPLAHRLALIHLQARSALSGDNNFLCQAAWMLAGGQSPVAEEIEPVFAVHALDLLEQARERWRNPEPIPRWCCDGTHSAGDDVRFMGVWFHMYAACLAFERYGRLDPEDKWLPEFNCYDGLSIGWQLPSVTQGTPAVRLETG